MSNLSDQDLENLVRHHFDASKKAQHSSDQAWQKLAVSLGSQQKPQTQHNIAGRVAWATVWLLVIGSIAAVLYNKAFLGPTPRPGIYQPVSQIGSTLGPMSTPGLLNEVIFSTTVEGWQMPCLGYNISEIAPSLQYRIEIAKTDQSWPGSTAFSQTGITFLTRVYRVSDNAEVYEVFPPDWGRLRAAYGGPNWAQDNPLYISPDGQPSMAELLADLVYRQPGNNLMSMVDHNAELFQQGLQNDDQEKTLSGWTVKVVSAYADDREVVIGYTITGPNQPYVVDKIAYKKMQAFDYAATEMALYKADRRGPSGYIQGLYLDLTKTGANADVQFEIPAIHVRPASGKDSCSPPLIADNKPAATLPVDPIDMTAPDVETVGPFTFYLQVPVNHAPTPIPQPSPIPTKPILITPQPPQPVQTGEPQPIATTSK